MHIFFLYSSFDQSLNIFENLNIEDASLEGYIRRHSNNSLDDDDNLQSRANEQNFNAVTVLNDFQRSDDVAREMKQFEELLTAKDAALCAITGELESVKDAASNHSTLSYPTSTEYKQYQEEYQNRVSFSGYCRYIY